MRLISRITAIAALSILAGSLFAATTVPNVFVNGTVADADEVNENFEALANAIDSIPAGPEGPPGPQGVPGPQGIPGPYGPKSWVQLYDRNYTNELTANGYVNLSNAGVNAYYSSGGFSMTSEHSVTNDTLVFPGPGKFMVNIQVNTSFLLPLPAPAFGTPFQILFVIRDGNGIDVSDMVHYGIVPNDENALIGATLTRNVVIGDMVSAPKLSIRLDNFNYALAFLNQLSVFNVVIHAQQLE
jgi:hypothetical protein